MEAMAVPRGMGSDPVAAGYDRFRAGLERARGYCLREEGTMLSLDFEPWFAETDRTSSLPCMRIAFRRDGDRIVLESFLVDDGSDTRSVDIDAAHDALQAWMDYMSD